MTKPEPQLTQEAQPSKGLFGPLLMLQLPHPFWGHMPLYLATALVFFSNTPVPGFGFGGKELAPVLLLLHIYLFVAAKPTKQPSMLRLWGMELLRAASMAALGTLLGLWLFRGCVLWAAVALFAASWLHMRTFLQGHELGKEGEATDPSTQALQPLSWAYLLLSLFVATVGALGMLPGLAPVRHLLYAPITGWKLFFSLQGVLGALLGLLVLLDCLKLTTKAKQHIPLLPWLAYLFSSFVLILYAGLFSQVWWQFALVHLLFHLNYADRWQRWRHEQSAPWPHWLTPAVVIALIAMRFQAHPKADSLWMALIVYLALYTGWHALHTRRALRT